MSLSRLTDKTDPGNRGFFSLAHNESCVAHETAQLLIFVCGITKELKITEELAATRSVKGTGSSQT